MHSRSTRLLHLSELMILRFARSALPDGAASACGVGRIMPTRPLVQLVLDPSSAAAIFAARASPGGTPARTSTFCSSSVSPAPLARSSPRPSTPSVSPILLQHLDLRAELLGLAPAATDEDIEHVLDLPRSS